MKTYAELYSDLNQRIHEYIEKTYPSPVHITDDDLDLLFLLLRVRDCFQYCLKKYKSFEIVESVVLEKFEVEGMRWHIPIVIDRALKSPLIIGTKWETYFNEILLEKEEFE